MTEAFPVTDFIDKKAEKYENANEEANIVVSAYSEKQAHRVQNKLSGLKHMNHTQHNKR